jgi:hypothetical protein
VTFVTHQRPRDTSVNALQAAPRLRLSNAGPHCALHFRFSLTVMPPEAVCDASVAAASSLATPTTP